MRFSVLLFLIVSLPAAAQTELGARLGVSAATVTGEFATADAAQIRYGFVGGLTLSFPLRYSFVLRAEALYTQKGFTTEEAAVVGAGGTPVSAASVTFDLTTLDLPLLLAYELSASRELEVEVFGGPYLGFELSERLRVEPDVAAVSEESDLFRGTDLGFVVGVGVSFAAGGFQPSLGVRYARSLADRLEESASAVPDAAAYNSVVSFLLGLRL